MVAATTTREQWASAALEDCRELLADDETVHVALGLLDEVASRWEGLPQATEAREILDQYEAMPDKPWVEAARDERLRQTAMLARVYDEAARSIKINGQAKRGTYAAGAIENYQVLVRDGDPEQAREAQARIEMLRPFAEKLRATRAANQRGGSER